MGKENLGFPCLPYLLYINDQVRGFASEFRKRLYIL